MGGGNQGLHVFRLGLGEEGGDAKAHRFSGPEKVDQRTDEEVGFFAFPQEIVSLGAALSAVPADRGDP